MYHAYWGGSILSLISLLVSQVLGLCYLFWSLFFFLQYQCWKISTHVAGFCFFQVAYFVGVQIEDDYKNDDFRRCWRPDMKQLSVVGVVKVAVRSLSMSAGSSNT